MPEPIGRIVSSLQYKSPEASTFPQPELPQRWSTNQQHGRDSAFLLLLVTGYLLALAVGIVLLGLLTPVSHQTSVAASEARSH
jgi:hypothetical protein